MVVGILRVRSKRERGPSASAVRSLFFAAARRRVPWSLYNAQVQEPEASEQIPPQKLQEFPTKQPPLLQTPALHTSLDVQRFPSQLAAPSAL